MEGPYGSAYVDCYLEVSVTLGSFPNGEENMSIHYADPKHANVISIKCTSDNRTSRLISLVGPLVQATSVGTLPM